MSVSISVTLRSSVGGGSNDGPIEGRFIYIPSSTDKGVGRWSYQTLTSAGYVAGKPPKRFFRRQRVTQ
jgi:hypothetical protein